MEVAYIRQTYTVLARVVSWQFDIRQSALLCADCLVFVRLFLYWSGTLNIPKGTTGRVLSTSAAGIRVLFEDVRTPVSVSTANLDKLQALTRLSFYSFLCVIWYWLLICLVLL